MSLSPQLSPLPVGVFAVALSLGAMALGLAVAASDALTDEDIVRMFVAGTSTDEIVGRIATGPADFDVSPDMLEELRRAGLPTAVIDAMIVRQRAIDDMRRAAEAAEDSVVPETDVLLRITLDGALRYSDQVDPQLAAEWELGNAPEDRVFADLALFLACETADHVPDQWRVKSPLGRDFISMPRHRLLEFLAGAERTEKKIGAGGTLEVDLPEALEVVVESHVMHDLIIGIAMQVGGRYYRASSDAWRDILVGDETVELSVKIRSGRRGLRIRFERPDDDETSEDDS